MPDLLLELFSEEIPARMQVAASEHLSQALKKALNVTQAESFSTPRRLGIIIKDLPAAQPDISTELKGPKIDAPEAALQGFLKKSGLKLEQLEKRDGVYFASIHQKGKPTAEVLKSVIEDILANFPWPKSMRWGSGDATWVRPLHAILCIFDGKVIPVEFAGVKAGNFTFGHRFLSPEKITIASPAEYESKLEKAHVIADRGKRMGIIRAQAEKAAAAKNLAVKKDDALLEEVTGLVEYPVALMGAIDEKFMGLPPEVLTTVMRSHQKYFSLNPAGHVVSAQDPMRSCADAGASHRIAAHFLIIANTDKGEKNVIAGNERVLRARFSDARFFWDQDRKKPLSDWAKGLGSVTFHAKLGSIADKVERIKNLALAIAESIPARASLGGELIERAAKLCKADLVTGMVGEFAELQGIMGRYYALAQKEDAAVADAIRDHYKPQGPADSVPTQPVSIFIALADKLDTLVSMFAIGEKPTGSKDPFALRRAALGVIRIILENNIRISLKKFLNDELLAFFADRLKVQLKDSGIRHDVISAVVAGGDDDLVRIVARAKALQEFVGSDDGANLLTAYKRAANILAIEEKKDKAKYDAPVPLDAFALPEEKALKQAISQAVSGVEPLFKAENFTGAMAAFSTLRAPVDTFFDKVMVNDKDAEIRKKRLCLLAELRQTFDRIANFALIEG